MDLKKGHVDIITAMREGASLELSRGTLWLNDNPKNRDLLDRLLVERLVVEVSNGERTKIYKLTEHGETAELTTQTPARGQTSIYLGKPELRAKRKEALDNLAKDFGFEARDNISALIQSIADGKLVLSEPQHKNG